MGIEMQKSGRGGQCRGRSKMMRQECADVDMRSSHQKREDGQDCVA